MNSLSVNIIWCIANFLRAFYSQTGWFNISTILNKKSLRFNPNFSITFKRRYKGILNQYPFPRRFFTSTRESKYSFFQKFWKLLHQSLLKKIFLTFTSDDKSISSYRKKSHGWLKKKKSQYLQKISHHIFSDKVNDKHFERPVCL